MIPKDPNMLVSYVNLGLRDKYEDFEDMAANEGFDADEIIGESEKKIKEGKYLLTKRS